MSSSEIYVSWNNSSDSGSGVAGYFIYRNGSWIGFTTEPTTSWLDSGLSSGTAYSYSVLAYDNAWPSNMSSQSSSASATTFTSSSPTPTPSTTPTPSASPTPSEDLTSPTVPTNLSVTAVSSSEIDLSWSASEDYESGVGGYAIYRDGLWIANTAGTSWSDTGLSADTGYSYSVSAYDNNWNYSGETSSMSATTFSSPSPTPSPTPSVTPTPSPTPEPDTTPPTAGTPTSNPVITSVVVPSVITIQGTASDNVGVSKVEFWRSLDGGPVTKVKSINVAALRLKNISQQAAAGSLIFTDTTSPYNYVWNVTSLDNGTNQFMIKAFDTATPPNTTESSPLTINVTIPLGGDLSGWAWSDQYGWISFNCTDQSVCGQSNYRVTASPDPDTVGKPTILDLSGYAWSSSVGWLSFNPGDVSSYCSSAGASAPTLDFADGRVSGWAVFRTGAAGYAANNSGGWDGCLELSGTLHSSPDSSGTGGVTLIVNPSDASKGQFTGYAWDGWINFMPYLKFSHSIISKPVICPGCVPTPPSGGLAVSCTPPSNPIVLLPGNDTTDVTFTASPTGGSYTYSWTAGSCSGSTCTLHNLGPGTYSPENGNAPTLTVTDGSGSQGFDECAVTVQGATTNAVSLKIGGSAASATLNSYTVNQGKPFALKWSVPAVDTNYVCSTNVTDANNNSVGHWQGSTPNWYDDGSGDPGERLLLNQQSQEKLDTDIGTGKYNFWIDCEDFATGKPKISSKDSNNGNPNYLIIKKSSVIEI